MRAVVYHGPHDISVTDVPDARDRGTRPTSSSGSPPPTSAAPTCTCTRAAPPSRRARSSATRTWASSRRSAPASTAIKVGDRVSVPFNIACGTCRNCLTRLDRRSACAPTRPRAWTARPTATPTWARTAAARPSSCGCRTPTSTCSSCRQGTEHENDFTMLSDIFPTGWHGTELAGVQPGRPRRRVRRRPGRPDGRAQRADPRAPREVFVVDKEPDRLALAEQIGATPIDFSAGDPVEQIMDATDGRGVDRGVEAVGYQAHDPHGEEHPELVLDNLVDGGAHHRRHRRRRRLRAAGPGCARRAGASRAGSPFDVRHVLHQGPADGHRPGAGEALQPAAARPHHRRPGDTRRSSSRTSCRSTRPPDGYEHFDARDDGWTKVLLHPAGSPTAH